MYRSSVRRALRPLPFPWEWSPVGAEATRCVTPLCSPPKDQLANMKRATRPRQNEDFLPQHNSNKRLRSGRAENKTVLCQNKEVGGGFILVSSLTSRGWCSNTSPHQKHRAALWIFCLLKVQMWLLTHFRVLNFLCWSVSVSLIALFWIKRIVSISALVKSCRTVYRRVNKLQ